MTFNQMVFKMLKANLRRYLLYYLCSSFTVMIFFTYSTLWTNKDFTNPYKVNSAISSNIIAPGVILLVFSVFFIFYTQNAFDKYRKSEFGLFMVLGLTHKNIAKMIALENGIVAIISVMTGLVAGTLFSGAFYFIVMKIIDIRGISFNLSIKSYLYTSVFFIVLYILVITYSLLSSFMYEIATMLKEPRSEDKNRITGLIAGITGVLTIGTAVFDMLHNFKTGNDGVFLRSLLLCSAGVYLLISNLVIFLKKILRSNPKQYYRNMLFIANLKYSFGQSKKILFLIALLTAITLFFSSIALILGADSEKFAVQHNPFHIAYAEIYGKNSISKETLDSIAGNGETPLISHICLEYIDKGTKSIFSDKKLNTAFGTAFQVRKGLFLNLFQIVENDGYTYNTEGMKDFEVNTKDGFSAYVSQGSVKKMLFNSLPIVAKGRYVILNDEDYRKLLSASDPRDIGVINLLNFKDWKKTEGIAERLKIRLEDYNKSRTKLYYETIEKENAAFNPATRIGTFNNWKAAGSFILFLFSFVGILFFISSGVILHFKLQTEMDREKVNYKKLYKVGITRNEMARTISKELKVLFFLPYFIGTLLAAFYTVPLIKEIGQNTAALSNTLVLSLIYLGFQLLYYLIYKRIYIKKITSMVEV
jgi:putative ABC transport system permease protein